MVLQGLALSLAMIAMQGGPAQGGTIQGVVTARVNGQAVSGATVTIEGTVQRATTNVLGRFRLEGVAPGRVSLIVNANGFLDFPVADVQVRENAPTDLLIQLETTPNIFERVQVTATKEPEISGDIPLQNSLITRNTIDERGDQSLVQALNHIPGAVVSSQAGVFESLMLRGMARQDTEFTNVLVLIDGVPQTLANNSARIVALPITDASSIEVTRGPGSALYGRNALAGTINIRTPDPTPQHHASFGFAGGQFETIKGVASFDGPIQNWGGYYASASGSRSHGFWKAVDGNGDLGSAAQFAKLTFAPDSKSFGSVSVNRVISDNSTPTNEPVINGQLLHEIEPEFRRLTSFNIRGTNYHQAEVRVTINYNRQVTPWLKYSQTMGYRPIQHKFINDGDFIGAPYDTVNHTVTMYPFSQQLDEDAYFNETRLELMPRLGNITSSAVLGYSYEWNGGGIDADFIYTDANLLGIPINYLNPVIPDMSTWRHEPALHRSYHQGIHGMFATYTISPLTRLTLTLGGRYDLMRLDHTRGDNYRIDRKLNAFSPRGSLVFKLLDAGNSRSSTLNFYASYAQSFVPPTRPTALNSEDPPLNAEDVDNYEAGLKASVMNGRLSMQAGYFWMDETGVVLTRRVGPEFLPTNAGKVRYRGAEAGVDFSVTKKISTYLNGSIYRNRFRSFVIETSSGDTVLTGNRLPISPDRVFNGGVNYAPIRPVNFNLNVKHVGPVQGDNINSFKLSQYTVVDAGLTWRRGPARITLSGHNLGNTEYYWTGGETADPAVTREVQLAFQFDFRKVK